VALIYSKDVLSVIPIQEIEHGEVGTNNDYVYYFSFEFCKF